jgi:hypothetical protein
MTQQTKALRLAESLETKPKFSLSYQVIDRSAAELRRLEHNTTILMNALMKACGDDEEMVKEIIESQGELK